MGPLFGALRTSPHLEVLKRYLVNRAATGDSPTAKALAGIKTKQQGDNTCLNRLRDALRLKLLKASRKKEKFFSKPSLLPLAMICSEKFKVEKRSHLPNNR